MQGQLRSDTSKMHYWVQTSSSDFSGSLPQPRSGHTAVLVGKSKIVVFGGLIDKKFLSHITVYDIEKKVWFQPECSGSGSNGQVGPSPRAFHVAVSIDCHMFIFGGRSGGKRMGDFWVLDTDIWQWSELTSFGDLPSPRDFAAASSIGNRKIVMYGGWDGKKWLSDVYILDTISLEWMELPVTGVLPPPRCGHTAIMVEKRLLVFGGRGGGGPIMGDLWALKGLIEEDTTLQITHFCGYDVAFHFLVGPTDRSKEENETPGWTQLKLPGQAPSPRCGHTITSGGHYLMLFGGHGTGGWLSRYDIYYNDCIVLDRVYAQWKRLPTSGDPPPARAYHSMTCIGSRYLLFGGFDGKSTFGDLWWLVPEGDPIAKQLAASLRKSLPKNNDMGTAKNGDQSAVKESRKEESAISELQRRSGIAVSLSSSSSQIVDEAEDGELCDLASGFMGDVPNNQQRIQALRDHWKNSSPRSMPLKELGPLLRDYQRLITRHHLAISGADAHFVASRFPGKYTYQFYHMKNASQLRMDDVPKLLSEYNQLSSD